MISGNGATSEREKENVPFIEKTTTTRNSEKERIQKVADDVHLLEEEEDDDDDDDEERDERATTIEKEAANINSSREEEEEEEEEDFIRIKRRVRGTEAPEEEEEEAEKKREEKETEKNDGKEEEDDDDDEKESKDEAEGVAPSNKKKVLKHKSGERVIHNNNNRGGLAADDDAVGRGEDKFEFEIQEDDDAEEDEEEEDEERILERRFAETGRLSEDEEEDEESESELNFSSSSEEEDESSDSEAEEEGGSRRRGRGGRKATKKGGGRKKKPIDPNDKEAVMRRKKEEADEAHEKLMRKAAKHIHFPGYRVQPERTSFLPVIEKLQNNLRMVENDENLRARFPRPPPSPEKKDFHVEGDMEGASDDGVNEDVSEDEGKEGGEEKTNFDEIDEMDLLSEEEEEEMTDLEEESDSDAEADAELIRKSIASKKAKNVVIKDPTQAEDKDNAAVDKNENEEEDEEGDDDDGELSEEEEMTAKERREQRKLARNFYREDRKNQKKERRSKRATEGVDDEAEMSEDGGHTDDDDEDDIETARAEIDEMADFVDFREGTALDADERRNEARARAHAEREFLKDEEETKKMKELLENGFKRPRNGLNGEEDDDGKWKTRRKQEKGDDSESDSDSDDLRDFRPEDAVEVSDDEDEDAKAFKERQAQRFYMKKASGGDTQEMDRNDALPEVDEGKVSKEVMKLFEKDKNKKSTRHNNKGQDNTQSQTIANDLSNRGGSGSGLSRGNSQFSNLGAARTSSSISFLNRNGSSRSQSGFAKGIINGGTASRTFVFGNALDNSNSQWATQREGETMPSSLGNNLLGGDEARTGFGDDVANNNINSSASVRENKKKSLFAMLQKSTTEEDWEKEDSRIKNVVGK